MDKKNLKRSRTARGGLIGQSLQHLVALVAAFSLLLAPVAWADGRTQLTPGWNMFSPQQDAEVGQQASFFTQNAMALATEVSERLEPI